MTARPSEVRAVVDVLLAEHESPEACAKAAIAALDGSRADRVGYLVVSRFGQNGIPFAVGPYATERQAAKGAAKLPLLSQLAAIIRLRTPEYMEGRVNDA